MATIDELEEMDFINWDAAAPGTGFDLPVASSEGAAQSIDPVPVAPEEPNMNLVFENVDGDDWSFWAMEHFESTQMPQDANVLAHPDPEAHSAVAQMQWEMPESPCVHCALGGYQCKRISEGKYKGYCTSCVALRCECSFGPSINNLTADPGAAFPANPWPTMGDRPETSILLEDELSALVSPAPHAPGLVSVAEDKRSSQQPQNAPKIGARFSRESVKVLKNWLSTHNRHPYPTEEEKEGLQKMTGLNKTQIANWLANARRRGKIQPTRATSPHVGRGYAQAIDIPQRRGTPGLFENMDPLQRWANSPPENEPASVTAIARAVSASESHSQTSGSGRNSPWYVSNWSDDGSSRSLCNQSSASSLGTSHSSGGSFASAYSNQSRGSFGSVPSFVRGRGRRRRRRAPPKHTEDNLSQPLKTFQCTFCTETFRTKHDWQRHEKSLHLSLERWVCSPDGPRHVNPDNGLLSCVFCGESNPDDAHVESHNFSGCTERTQEERTFYRKDHLRQHLKLVHTVKFLPGPMDAWRVASPQIRSRCGFCGIVLDSWSIRVDHLAEHFKTGYTMADWKGDWGFETPVLDMVENSIPPYLIHDERKSPLPFMAGQPSPSTPNDAYELLKMELHYWVANRTEDTGRAPTDAEIQHEACRIIFGAEVSSKSSSRPAPSWLRDIIMSSDDVTRNAKFQPVRGQSQSLLSTLRINGKLDIFDHCDLERQLQDFVQARQLLGLTAMDHELQFEACRIIGRIEEKTRDPSEDLANFLIRLIHASPNWLQDFRQRAHLPRSEDIGDAHQRSKDTKTIDSTIHNYSRLEAELGQYLQQQRSLGVEPADADLQRQGRIIIYEIDDEWNQTAADDIKWLNNFRQRHPQKGISTLSTSNSSPSAIQPSSAQSGGPAAATGSGFLNSIDAVSLSCSGHPAAGGNNPNSIKTGPFFLNDANCYRRLARGLGRFVASTMSNNNPNSHVPTDQELQHQARWIVYDDDDPWNQTAADNAEWLQRFKVDVGILPPENGPGLVEGKAWAASAGGTGFAPPYVAPNPTATFEPLRASETTFLRDQERGFESSADTTNRFLQTFTQRYPAPAKIFCSRELEDGLNEYVRRELRAAGVFPGDAQLRERARHIMGMQKTPCDDPVLLGKFKAAALRGTATASSFPGSSPAPAPGALDDFGGVAGGPQPLPAALPTTSGISAGLATEAAAGGGGGDQVRLPLPTDMDMDLDLDLDLGFTEQELNSFLQDVSPDFVDGTQLNDEPDPSSSQGDTGGAGSGLGF